MELASAAEEGKETVFDIKYTAPQHRQYLEYGVCIDTLTVVTVATTFIEFV